MAESSFASPLNFVRTTLRLPYVPGSGQFFVSRGYGASINQALVNQGLPSISATAPLRFLMVQSQFYNSQTGQIILPSAASIFEATALTGDNLTGGVAVEGTVDQAFSAGDVFLVQLTAGQIIDIQSAVQAIQSGSGAPANGTYILQTANSGLSNAQALSSLATGILKSTTTTGVISIAAQGVDYVIPTGSGAGLTGITSTQTGSLAIANNLSDVLSTSSARTNLGLGTAAVQAATFFAQVANNLSDLANTATARTNLGLGTAATQASTTFASVINLTTDNVVYSTPISFTNTSGTFAGALALKTQAANIVFAGPTSGSAAAPTFRAIVAADLPATVVLTSGSYSNPAWITSILGSIVSGNIAGNAANVTGTVAIANGGTGQTAKTAAFDALQPMTTVGDIIYGGTSGSGTRLAGNTAASNLFLRSTGTGAAAQAPTLATIAEADVTNLASDLLIRPPDTYTTASYYLAGNFGTINANQTTNSIFRCYPIKLSAITIKNLGAEVTVIGDAGRGPFSDLVTNSTPTITSATASFVSTDQGRLVTGTNIPANTWIASVTNGTTAVMTQAASGSGSGGSLTISGAVFRCGLYADNGAGIPGSLLIDAGTIDGHSATVQVSSVNFSLALTGGIYWIGGAIQGTTTTQPTLRTASNICGWVPNGSLPSAGLAGAGLISGIAAALPPTFSNGGFTTVVPRMFFKT